jgi:raffinose/stachyose/melibiose transport system substrate-binding protein
LKKPSMKALVLATAFSLFLAACGGNAAPTSGTNNGTGEENTNQTENTSEKEEITLTFQTHRTDASTPAYQVEAELVEQYMEENPHVTVEWDRLDTEQQKVKLKTQAASGEVADITAVNPGAQLEPFADGDVLAPLNDMLDEEFKNVFLDGVLEYYTFDDTVYALPYNMNIAGLFYNKELFEQAGVQPPATFDELISTIETLKAEGINPMMLAGKDNWPLSFMFTNILQRVNGEPKFLDGIVTGENKFTDPVFVEALQKTKEIVNAGAYQEGAVTFDYNTAAQQWRDGKAAMYYMGTWEVSSTEASSLAGKVGFIPFPTINGKGDAGDFVVAPGTAYAIGANSEHLEESKALVKYILENYASVSFEKKAAVGLALKVEGDYEAAGYSDLSIDVVNLFNTVKGGDMNFDNIIEPTTTQTHLTGIQRFLVDDDVDVEALAQEHQDTWDLNN